MTVTNGAAQVQAYTATLVDAKGHKSDITDSVSFALTDTMFGSWQGTNLTVTGAAAGPTMITATDGDANGSTGLTVYVKGARGDGTVPANADQLFGTATESAGRAPKIAYPDDGIVVPPNLGAFDVHWNDTASNDLFQVELKNQYVDLIIYKQATGAVYTTYTPNEWTTIASAHTQLTLTVSGLSTANPATKGTSTPQHVDATNEVVAGGVYYWQNEPTQGVYRYDMSTPNVPPSSFFPAGQQPTTCVGCHGLSHDGTKIAVTLDSGDGRGTVLDVASYNVLVPYATNPQYWNFATFNQDASKVVTVFQGAMVLRATSGGTVLANIPNSGSMKATHPELSPDGTMLANVETTQDFADYQVSDGSIVVRSFNNATNAFGPIKTLVPNAPSASNYYPSWSPDGQWLLFTRTMGNSYSDASAQVWVVKADGSQPPIQLNLADKMAGQGNSWARWAPFTQTYGANGEQLFYITFSSKRAFGVRPLSSSQWGVDPQIWMAPFFPDRATQGMDPSGPAFRMPFQDLAAGNHIAQWTQAIVIARKNDGTPLTQAEAAGMLAPVR